METYVVLRRGGWRTEEELEAAAEVSTRVSEEMDGQVVWIRTYVLAEADGTLGTVCVYQAESEDAAPRARPPGGPARRTTWSPSRRR